MVHSTSMSGTSVNKNSLGEPDESTRLLVDEERDGCSSPSQSRGPTPLPKAQLGTLVAVRIVDPIAYTQIFPYINQLLADLHIAAPEQVGFYSGFIVSTAPGGNVVVALTEVTPVFFISQESAYSLAQMVSVYQWGRLSGMFIAGDSMYRACDFGF